MRIAILTFEGFNELDSIVEAASADAVIVGSGIYTRDIVKDAALMSRIQLDPARQLIASQCSGTLILAKLGLLAGST